MALSTLILSFFLSIIDWIQPTFVIYSFLFGALTIGLLHGSFDYDAYQLTFKPNKIYTHVLFFLLYISSALFIFILFQIFPLLTFCLFLLYSAYHFGTAKEYGLNMPYSLLYGLSLLTLPTIFYHAQMKMIYGLFLGTNHALVLVEFSQYLAIISTIIIAFSLLQTKNWYALSALISSLIATPLAFFTTFFCLEHSWNYVNELTDRYHELINQKIIYRGCVFFLASVVLVFIIARKFNEVDLTHYALFKSFIYMIAALSFPHLILIACLNNK
jgi:Brp/Blh family beta-carotene 15,15'-monooxygenase